MASSEDKDVQVTKSNEEVEKPEGEVGSSTSSEAGSPTEQDLEKGAPVKAKSIDEKPDPSDPNVVDWEGDDDPENPMNW